METKYIFYDVETTGLTNSDEVVQFGAFVTDKDMRLKQQYSFYCYTQVAMSEGASNVTGLTKEKIYHLSGGKTFEDNFLQLPFVKSNKNNIWVSYSSAGFDERLVNQTLEHNGLKRMRFGSKTLNIHGDGHSSCVYNAMEAMRVQLFSGKRAKLSEACARSGLTEEQLDRMFKKTVPTGEVQFHDALYDAFALWAVVYKNKRKLGFELC